MAARSVLLAPGVIRIPTAGDFINSFAFLEPDGSVTLVDCGIARAPARIVAALAAVGRHPADVQRIILTHAHPDHAGGAAELVVRTGVMGVHAHEDDREYLEEGRTAPSSGGRWMDRLPSGKFSPVSLAGTFTDGEQVDVLGGLTVVHTPGHTPGHVSLLHPGTGVLITGDCLFNPLSRLRWPIGRTCTSPAQNRASARRLADLDFDLAAFTHGPEIRDRPRERIRDFLVRGKGAR